MASAISAMSLVACVFIVVVTWAVVKLFGLID
jgi:hypothetical protein